MYLVASVRPSVHLSALSWLNRNVTSVMSSISVMSVMCVTSVTPESPHSVWIRRYCSTYSLVYFYAYAILYLYCSSIWRDSVWQLGVSKRGSRYPKYPNFKRPISRYPNFKGPISQLGSVHYLREGGGWEKTGGLVTFTLTVSFWVISQYPKSATGIPISLFLWANIPNSGIKLVISQYPNLS